MDAKTQKNVELLMEISEDAEELGAYKTHYQNVSKMAKRLAELTAIGYPEETKIRIIRDEGYITEDMYCKIMASAAKKTE